MNPGDNQAGPTTGEQRLGPLVGDRFCAACGFNLVSQTIVREPHYAMLMVRCPECGTCACLQEYPVLGPLAGRLARLLAVLLLLLTLAGIGVSSLVMWGLSIPAVETMSQPLAERIGAAHAQWQLEQAQASAAQQPAQPATPTGPGPGGAAPQSPAAITLGPPSPTAKLDTWTRYIESQWARKTDMGAILRSQGGFGTAIDWSGLRWLIPAAPVAIGVGAVFSVLLLGTPRRRVALVIPLILTLSTTWAAMALTDGALVHGGRASDAAMEMIGLRLHLVVYLFAAQLMLVGVWLGRPLARLAVRALLPPRLCGSLSDLWLVDGLSPPYGALARRPVRSGATNSQAVP